MKSLYDPNLILVWLHVMGFVAGALCLALKVDVLIARIKFPKCWA
jgi:hypothetical protein